MGAGRAHARRARAAGAHRRHHRVRAAVVHPVPHAARAARTAIEEISREENLKHTAVFRLALGRTIPNVQASWVKMGLDAATEALRWGVNDLGGTLMEEIDQPPGRQLPRRAPRPARAGRRRARAPAARRPSARRSTALRRELSRRRAARIGRSTSPRRPTPLHDHPRAATRRSPPPASRRSRPSSPSSRARCASRSRRRSRPRARRATSARTPSTTRSRTTRRTSRRRSRACAARRAARPSSSRPTTGAGVVAFGDDGPRRPTSTAGREQTFTIVGPTEADLKSGRLSAESPVASALLGAAPGDEVDGRDAARRRAAGASTRSGQLTRAATAPRRGQ